jgi:hypothetical protein
MKNTYTKILSTSFISGLALFASFSTTSAATPIVDWGGDDVIDESTSFNAGSTEAQAGSLTYLYSDSTVRSPSTGGYTQQPFYGAFSVINNSGTGSPDFVDGRFGVNSTSSIRIGIQPAVGSQGAIMRGLVFFQKDDFLTTTSGSITFDENSSISLSTSSSSGSTRQVRGAVHAQVNGEWSWYVSQSVSASSIGISNAGGQLWAEYAIDSLTAPLLDAASNASSEYNTLGTGFEEIDAVGFFFHYERDVEEVNALIFVDQFEVTAVIPEVQSYALFLGGAALSLLTFKHRV